MQSSFQKFIHQLLFPDHFVNDQEGIYRRFKREKENWLPHLENTKQFILKGLREAKGRVLVLGSGWLLDFPTALFANNELQFYLCDLKHPEQVSKQWQENTQVHFLEMDATGGLVEVARNASSAGEFIQQLENFQATPFMQDYDWVISLNIWNQLDILLVEYLEKKFVLSDAERKQIQQYVQAQHLEQLQQRKSLLISDYKEMIYTMKGEYLHSRSLVYTDVEQWTETSQWDWNFDTKGRYYANKKTVFRVVAKVFQ